MMSIFSKNKLCKCVKFFIFKIFLLTCFFCLPIHGKTLSQDEINVRDAFLKWANNFNARDRQHVCDLFSPNLIWVTLYSSYKQVPEKNYKDICVLLQQTINNKTKQYHYSPHIKEIILSDHFAIVRVVWTLSISSYRKKQEVIKEHSMDIMEKQADGKTWKMIRFVAYEIPVKYGQ